MSARIPTRKQFECLRKLADPGVLLVSGICGEYRRQWEACIAHGWLELKWPGKSNGARITPAGLRALADALEKQRLAASPMETQT